MKAKTFLFIFVFFLQTVLVSSAFAAIRIMPLGDSITQGYASGELIESRQISYRKALWDKLLNAGYDVDFVGSLDSGSMLFDDGDHEGHPGWTDDEIVDGKISEPLAGQLDEWLVDYQPDVVLLHIGINGLAYPPLADDVECILDVIEDYENAFGVNVWVILARIINRVGHFCPDGSLITDFNDNVEAMAQERIDTLSDKIIIVEMECGAGIDYILQPDGDMYNDLHPYQYGTGYDKMADVWFDALEQILPDPNYNPGPDPPNNSSISDSGCFISTATYGLHMEPHIKAPVDFRDHFLFTNFVGRTFVDLYHSIRHLRQISTLDVFIK